MRFLMFGMILMLFGGCALARNEQEFEAEVKSNLPIIGNIIGFRLAAKNKQVFGEDSQEVEGGPVVAEKSVTNTRIVHKKVDYFSEIDTSFNTIIKDVPRPHKKKEKQPRLKLPTIPTIPALVTALVGWFLKRRGT